MGLIKSITVNNKTGSNLSYLSGIVTIPASSNTVITTGILAFLFNDDSFIDDIWKLNVSVTTSRGELTAADCFDYIVKNVDALWRSSKMALSLKTAMVPIDANLESLNAWIGATTVNTIESIVATGGQFVIVYT